MNLILFGVICAVALVMIIIGLTRPHESAQALIGFTFLFLLSIIIINGNLEVESGALTNTTYTYDSMNRVNFTSQDVQYHYEKFNDSTSHKIGFYLAIASVIGFAGVLYSIKRMSKNDY